MTKEYIYTDKAPSAIGAYSQAIKAGNYIFISGQIPLDPDTMEVISKDFIPQIIIPNINEKKEKVKSKQIDDVDA